MVPQARVLASSVRRHHPDARVVVLLSGEPVVAGDGEPFEALSLAELAGPEPASRGGRLLADALRPRMLQQVLDGGADVAVFLDAETCVYGSLEPAVSLAREHGLVVVRRLTALPEDRRTSESSDVIAAGMISPALLAVSRSRGRRAFPALVVRAGRPARPGGGEVARPRGRHVPIRDHPRGRRIQRELLEPPRASARAPR